MTEPSPGDLRLRGVPGKALEEIGKATGARYGNTLCDDDLPGKPGDAEHSWLGLMRYNYVTMVNGLGGKADKPTPWTPHGPARHRGLPP